VKELLRGILSNFLISFTLTSIPPPTAVQTIPERRQNEIPMDFILEFFPNERDFSFTL